MFNITVSFFLDDNERVSVIYGGNTLIQAVQKIFDAIASNWGRQYDSYQVSSIRWFCDECDGTGKVKHPRSIQKCKDCKGVGNKEISKETIISIKPK